MVGRRRLLLSLFYHRSAQRRLRDDHDAARGTGFRLPIGLPDNQRLARIEDMDAPFLTRGKLMFSDISNSFSATSANRKGFELSMSTDDEAVPTTTGECSEVHCGCCTECLRRSVVCGRLTASQSARPWLSVRSGIAFEYSAASRQGSEDGSD